MKNSIKIKLIFVLLFVLLFVLFFLVAKSYKDNQQAAIKSQIKIEEKKEVDLNIMVTDKIIYNMTKEIIKDKHHLEYMFKDSGSLINFKFTEDSLSSIKNMDLFLFMGVGYEPWINAFIDKLDKSKVGPVNLSRGTRILSYSKEVVINNFTIKDNPYYLLNSDNYKIALLNIKNSIQDKDPKNREEYEKNFNEAIKNIDIYTKDIKETAGKLSDTIFVYDEDEIEYFIKQLDLKSVRLNKNSKDLTQPLLAEDTENVMKEAKIMDYKNVVFLYNNDKVISNNGEFIKKNNIVLMKVSMPNYSAKYEQGLKQNLDLFKNYYDAKVKTTKP